MAGQFPDVITIYNTVINWIFDLPFLGDTFGRWILWLGVIGAAITMVTKYRSNE